MSFIDWSAAALPSQIQGQNLQNQNAQLDLVNKNRALNALRGVNLSDQGSVQNALNGAVQSGNVGLAKATSELAQSRAVNQANLPNIQGLAGIFGTRIAKMGGAQPDPQQSQSGQPTPQQLQQAQGTLQAAGEAIARVKAAPPEQRSQILDQEAQQFQVSGLDPAAIGAVKQHLADSDFSDESLDDLTNHYAEHAQNYGTMAAGGPPGDNLSTHPTNTYGPGTDNAAQTLNDPLYTDPLSMGYSKGQLGVDLGQGADLAANLTANQRAAPFQTVTAEDAQGRPNTLSAKNFAEGQLQPGASPIVGATPYTKASQADLAAAPYNPVTTNTGPGGAPQTQSALQFAQGRGAPQAPGAGPGPANAPPLTAPSPAAATVNQAGGTQYASDLVTAGQSQQQVNALQQIIRLLPTTNIGPGVEATNNMRSFLQTQLPILNKIIPGADERAIATAHTNELQKYMAQLASAASGQYGPASDAKLAEAISGNPHMSMDNLSAADVTKTMLALKRADLAKPYLFSTTNADPSQYAGFSSNYARTVDPRAFELDMLTAPQRQAMMATITSPEDKAKFTRGVQAAEAAGYYHRSDLPR